jgi:hypothetical protein
MLSLLIDENLNHRILRGLLRSVPQLDYVLISAAGLKGADDPAILELASREQRVIITHDLRTIPKYAYERIKSGMSLKTWQSWSSAPRHRSFNSSCFTCHFNPMRTREPVP